MELLKSLTGRFTRTRAPINQSLELRVPFDVIDHIFSFLKSHPKALLACSKAHPVLSQIVERYRFHHIVIHTGVIDFNYSFRPSGLLRRLAETPWIIKYVAVLQIEFNYHQYLGPAQMTPYLEEIASLLPMFPVLECIMLPTRRSGLSWQDLPQRFRSAVENCLHLPTLQEVHVGDMYFPLSMLDNHANINYLSLSGPPEIEPVYLKTTYPQIKSLAFEGFEHRYSGIFRTWAKRHIVGLQSLKYDLSCHKIILDVLEICSGTLENLYLCLQRQVTPPRVNQDLINLSSFPHLRHLTIHTEIYFEYDGYDHITRRSFLRLAVDILKTASSLQQLSIEIYVAPSELDLDIDLSPLRVLTESSVCFHHIDLYMYTGSPLRYVTHAKMGSLLAEHGGLMKLIEQGVLVIHPEETAPTLSRSYIARENTCIIM